MSSSQQNWLTRATEVCNMSSGPVKQLHTAGDLFLPKTKREDRGERAMRVGHRTGFKGRRYLYMGRIGLVLHKNQVNFHQLYLCGYKSSTGCVHQQVSRINHNFSRKSKHKLRTLEDDGKMTDTRLKTLASSQHKTFFLLFFIVLVSNTQGRGDDLKTTAITVSLTVLKCLRPNGNSGVWQILERGPVCYCKAVFFMIACYPCSKWEINFTHHDSVFSLSLLSNWNRAFCICQAGWWILLANLLLHYSVIVCRCLKSSYLLRQNYHRHHVFSTPAFYPLCGFIIC